MSFGFSGCYGFSTAPIGFNMKELLKSTDSEDRLFSNLAATWSSGAMFTPDSHIKILRSHVDEQTAAFRTALEAERAKVVEAERSEQDCRQIIHTYSEETEDQQKELDALRALVVKLREASKTVLDAAESRGRISLDNDKEELGRAILTAVMDFRDILALPLPHAGKDGEKA